MMRFLVAMWVQGIELETFGRTVGIEHRTTEASLQPQGFYFLTHMNAAMNMSVHTLLFSFQAGLHYGAQVGHGLAALSSPPPKCWDCQGVPHA